jgi:sucrose-6-phosphate hydrolase SacC (GH32 family)
MAFVLALPDDWVWDSWVADDGERYHLFFLKAPRALGDPALRHTSARVGHATSMDLVQWTVHDDTLAPAAGRWDDLAIWTGSVQRGGDGLWRFYYSALSTEGGLGTEDQRIGVAVSSDLFSWARAGEGPLIVPDARWYHTLAGAPGRSCTWRDPFVFADPDGAGWHMLITARAGRVPRLRSGVLAHARSADMRDWELQPPLSRPAGFGELEVAQVRIVEGQPLLVFTCQPERQSDEQVARFGRFATWYVVGDSLTGPWDVGTARPFVSEPQLSAAPLVQGRDGGWVFLGFRSTELTGPPSLEIVDPIRVTLRGGELQPL